MPFFALVLLAIAQGLTEFLPVSSSGHLVIISSLFKIPQDGQLLMYFVLVHSGTALAAVVFFRKEIKNIFAGWLVLLSGKQNARSAYAWKWTSLIVMVSVPTAVTGLLLKKHVEQLRFPYVVPIALIITALVLYASQAFKKNVYRGKGLKAFTYRDAFLVGLAQSFALMPGLSRSGSTIAVALLLGARPNFAGSLSFLASLLAIFGALGLETIDVFKGGVFPPLSYFAGFIVAFGVGLLSLRFLMMILNTRKLHYFSYYCLTVSIFYMIYLLMSN